MSKLDGEKLQAEVEAAGEIAAWTRNDYSDLEEHDPTAKAYRGEGQGWAFILVTYEDRNWQNGRGFVGTATKAGVVLKLSPRVAEKLVGLAAEQQTTTKWFGTSWNAPVNKKWNKTLLPATPCGYCGKAFELQDSGLVMPFLGSETDPKELGYHRDCFATLLGISDR